MVARGSCRVGEFQNCFVFGVGRGDVKMTSGHVGVERGIAKDEQWTLWGGRGIGKGEKWDRQGGRRCIGKGEI